MASMSFVTSVRPSLSLSALVSLAPTGQIFVKFGMGTFHGSLWRNCRFGWNRTTVWDITHVYVYSLLL